MRDAPTLTDFKLLRVLFVNSNANIKRPKRYNRQRYNFSDMLHMKDTLLPPSELVLITDVLVPIHPEKKYSTF